MCLARGPLQHRQGPAGGPAPDRSLPVTATWAPCRRRASRRQSPRSCSDWKTSPPTTPSSRLAPPSVLPSPPRPPPPPPAPHCRPRTYLAGREALAGVASVHAAAAAPAAAACLGACELSGYCDHITRTCSSGMPPHWRQGSGRHSDRGTDCGEGAFSKAQSASGACCRHSTDSQGTGLGSTAFNHRRCTSCQ